MVGNIALAEVGVSPSNERRGVRHPQRREDELLETVMVRLARPLLIRAIVFRLNTARANEEHHETRRVLP